MVSDAYLEGGTWRRIDTDTRDEYLPPDRRVADEKRMADVALVQGPWAGIDPIDVNDTMRNLQETVNGQRLG